MSMGISKCQECQSQYFSKTSRMIDFCPDCAHYLYDLENCDHIFENGRCVKCYWNGKTSDFIEQLKS
jgi:hypothetical protein